MSALYITPTPPAPEPDRPMARGPIHDPAPNPIPPDSLVEDDDLDDEAEDTAAGNTAIPLAIDRSELTRFVNAMFAGLDPWGYVSLRAFPQRTAGKPLHIEAIRLNLGLEPVIDAAVRIAAKVCNGGEPGVFAPPVCTFADRKTARATDVHEGPAISIEIDAGELQQIVDRIALIISIRPTIALYSGSLWADPETGGLLPKGHAHWRLAKPARGSEQLRMLRRARDIATLLAGGDPSATPPVHPMRWPGTWNLKTDRPVMARIFEQNDSTIDLADALAALEDAAQASGIETPRNIPHLALPDATPSEVAQIAEWLSFYPSVGLHWNDWTKLGLALERLTGGSEAGFELFRAWSEADPRYNPAYTRTRWEEIKGCPATWIGANFLRRKAREHGWVEAAPGETSEPEAEPAPTPPDPLQAEVERLAALPELEYDRIKQATAKELGLDLGPLNRAVRRARKAAEAKAREAARKKAEARAKVRPTDTPEVTALIAEFNAKYFVLNENGRAIVYAPKRDAQMNRRFFDRIEFDDLTKLYLNRTVKTGISDKTGEPIYSPVVQVWLRHRNRRQFIGGTVFDPSGSPPPPSLLNLWQGFAVTPLQGTCTKFKDHIREVICGNDPVLHNYVLDWMADVVQNPARQGEVALVLCGKEGCGKGVLARAMKYLLGQHGLAISNAKHLTGSFNGHLRDCVFLFADEAFFAGDKQHVGILKALITEKHLLIEAKYQNAVQMLNFLHLIMASNEPWVVPASLESRRFCVLAVAETHIGDHPYFAAIQHELEHGGYEALLHELLHRDLSNSNLRSVPVTDALITQRKHSLPTTEAWWLDCLHRGYVFRSKLGLEADFHQWLDPISTALLFDSYLEYCRAHHERRPLSRELFGRWLRSMRCIPQQPVTSIVGEHITDATTTGSNYTSRVAEPVWQNRARAYEVHSLDKARKRFTQATGLTVEWEDTDGT